MRYLLLAVVIAFGCGGAEETGPSITESSITGPSIEVEYWFSGHLGEADVRVGDAGALGLARWRIGDDERRVVFQAPPADIRFAEVPTGPGARLLVSPALDPRTWTEKTDGVGFEVICSGDRGKEISLLEIYSSPATRVEDRIWHESEVSLDACSSPTTDIRLITSCGPADNCAADWAGWGSARVVGRAQLGPLPNELAILISIDTLRADRLALYGGPRETSTQLERLAEDAIVFETAVAPAPWTIPSHASLLTSTDPLVHGADGETAIAEALAMLSESFSGAGWRTAAFVDTNFLGRDFGFARGFDHFDDEAPARGDYRRGARVLRERVIRWLAGAGDAPAFLFWHIMDVHGPYWAAPPFGGRFRGRAPRSGGADAKLGHLKALEYHDYLQLDDFESFEELVAAYDEGVAEVDSVLGGLFRTLREAGLYDDALIVVTSDHGESLLDHGVWVGHGLFLTEEEIRVPLLIKLPGNANAGVRVRGMVGLIDVAPSILDALGLEKPASFEGMSLLSPSPGHEAALPTTRFGHSSHTGASYLRQQGLKFIGPATISAAEITQSVLRPRAEVSFSLAPFVREQLYEVGRGFSEQAPLAASDAMHDALGAELAQYTAEMKARRGEVATHQSPAPELSREEKSRLRALGYAQ